ncbi:CGNR zinc finger domain-containing protein [Leifsonia sp. YIM 134122]|uniref:CGNR zinc finger domain-containing protein n=1 Tax=Leifsonia stereocauli TaxID=3134136 RepID=A0ABU9WB45_9MICO
MPSTTSVTPASPSVPTGQWFTTREGKPWWFDSGAPSLDFAYTGDLGFGHPEWEQLHSPEDLATWLLTRFPDSDGIVHPRHLTDGMMLRDAIGRLTVRASRREAFEPRDVDAVNLFAATPDIPPALEGGSRRAGRQTTSTNQAFATLARDAVAVFSADAVGRVRECAAEDCALVYVDTSRAGTRRWCSMQRCGNRAKVRKFRAAQAG